LGLDATIAPKRVGGGRGSNPLPSTNGIYSNKLPVGLGKGLRLMG